MQTYCCLDPTEELAECLSRIRACGEVFDGAEDILVEIDDVVRLILHRDLALISTARQTRIRNLPAERTRRSRTL